MSKPATFTITKIREAARGTGKKGPWTLYVIEGNDGKEYTTFKLNGLKVGNTVAISYEEVEAKGGRVRRQIVEDSKPADESRPANLADVITRLVSIEAKVDTLLEYYNTPEGEARVPF